MLLHGLASNARLWDTVGDLLARDGHHVIAVDQRGHGLSDTPDAGYDFDTVAGDLAGLVDALGLARPYIAGQSWGGNVVLAFAAANPGVARGLAFVDGGYINLGGDWDEVAERLRPPAFDGVSRDEMTARLRQFHPDLDDAGIEAILANFHVQPDGTVAPHLTLERHMTILRMLWEQEPATLYPHVVEPVLICVADDGDDDWMARKREDVRAAEAGLSEVQVRWFPETPHDIHLHRPHVLADALRDHNRQIA